MKTLIVISRAMAYPTDGLQAAVPEMRAAVDAEGLLPTAQRESLGQFLEQLQQRPLTELQQDYVSLFDRGRHLSLHLFEHVHGESRDRGQAMVDLMQHYQSHGYHLDARELPDYVPLFLEFLSTRDEQHISALLADAMPVLVLLGARLQEKGSGYASLFTALETIGGGCKEAAAMREQAASEGPDQTIEKMDEIWEEEQVTFMGNNDPAGGGCGGGQQDAGTTVPLRQMNPSPQTARQR